MVKGLKPMQIVRDILNSFLQGFHRSTSHDNFLDSYLTTKDNGKDDEARDRLKFVRDCKRFINEQEAAEISAWKCQEGGGVSEFLCRAYHSSFSELFTGINTIRLQASQGRATKADKRNSNKSEFIMGIGEQPHLAFVSARYEFDSRTILEYVSIVCSTASS